MTDMEKLREKLDQSWAMGCAAYERYTKALYGPEIARWEDLSTRIQDAWMAAAWAAWQEGPDT